MISVEEIKAVIAEQEADMQKLFSQEKIIKRELALGQTAVNYGAARIILGPRRCGKSVFAHQLAGKSKFGYAKFDDERMNLKAENLNDVLEAIYALKGDVDVLLFDEIQEVKGWEKFAARLVATNKVIITGSNARMMSKELATYMTGRHADVELLPFSFQEFLDYRGLKKNIRGIYVTAERARIKELLKEYLEIGGFPLATRHGRSYLADLYRDMIQKDIAQRHRIKMQDKLSDIARYLVAGSAQEITYNRLSGIFDIASKHTVQDWISYMEQAYLLFRLERFSFKLKESIMAPKKVYCIDTGIMNIMLPEHDIGRTMETVVAVELRRRNSHAAKGVKLNYWKNSAQEEVDFVIRQERKVLQLIQVTYASNYTDMRGREIANLIEGSVELRCSDLLCITWDYEGAKTIKGREIVFTPLWKWLLKTPTELGNKPTKR